MAAALSSAAMPQPSSFARSKDDILNALSFYFGQPVSPEKLKDYSEHQAATYHFPDAYSGTNTTLRDTINNLVEKSPQTWHTTIGLPFRRIEGTVVEWDEIAFDVRLLQRVPYEGVSRMTTSTKRKQRDRIVRRGLAMLIESDFYATEAGRAHFANQLNSIRYCVQETCNYDVLFSYLTSSNYDFHYDRQHNVRPRRNIRMALQHEISMYAIAQKEGRGLDKAVEDCKYRMKRYGVTPNLMIVPNQVSLYMSLAPEEKLSYREGGDKALAQFEAGVQGFLAASFRGCGVVTSDPFEVSDESEAVQMLQRYSQIGEYYLMQKPASVPPNAKNYMDVLVYDEERDIHVQIPFGDALVATGFFKKNGDTIALVTGGQGASADDTAAAAALDSSVSGDLTVTQWATAALALYTSAKNGTAIPEADKANVDKVVVCLARPFIEHSMLSAILCVAGADTGATLFGPSDMQISANTSVKTIEGHYTGHFKSVITKPQNVLVMRDIMANGYRAGGNTKFFGFNSDGEFSLSEARDQIGARLNFEADAGDDPIYASMLAFPMTTKQSEKIHNEITVTSRLLPWETHSPNDREGFPGGAAMYTFYKSRLGLDQVHYGEDLRASQNMEYMSQGSTNNSLCFTGPHRSFDSVTGAFTAFRAGAGHWGPDARPGDARWRRGESVSMQGAREQMLSFEQAQYIGRTKI